MEKQAVRVNPECLDSRATEKASFGRFQGSPCPPGCTECGPSVTALFEEIPACSSPKPDLPEG